MSTKAIRTYIKNLDQVDVREIMEMMLDEIEEIKAYNEVLEEKIEAIEPPEREK